MIDEFNVREIQGVRGVDLKDRINVAELTVQPNVRVEIQSGTIVAYSVDLNVDSARKLARQLNRIARRVELRNA